MKNLKIILISTTIAILAVATVGAVLAHSFADPPYIMGQTQYSTSISDEQLWNEMREHMEEHWNQVDQKTDGDWWDELIEHMDERLDSVPQDIQDQEWFNDMKAYIQDHVDEVQTQDWFEEMTQFMQEHRYEYGYRYSYSPRSYGRGCWGW